MAATSARVVQMMADLRIGDVLQCPVCLEEYSENGQILQCVRGHDICSGCRSRIHDCPVCRDNYVGTRNFGLESIVRSMQKAPRGGNRRAVVANVQGPPIVTYLNYPCLAFYLGTSARCVTGVDPRNLLEHIKATNCADFERIKPNNLEPVVRCNYETEFFDTPGLSAHGKIFHIPGYGIFYLIVLINSDSNKAYAWVAMPKPHRIAKTFSYSLKLSLNNIRMREFRGKVQTLLKQKEDIMYSANNCLKAEYISSSCEYGVIFGYPSGHSLDCSITLTRWSSMLDSEQSD